VLSTIRSLPAYQKLVDDLRGGQRLEGLALAKSARLPVLATLYQDLGWPVLFITDRTDHALTLLDELSFWLPDGFRQIFPAPNPLFYEQAIWGAVTRRDRLQALTSLALYHLAGGEKPVIPPVLITPIRALMARTLPRRDFIKYSKTLQPNQVIQPETLLRTWVDIGYQPSDIVVETGQFSRRGGILDVWPPAESSPVRLEFYGNEIETLRRFDPASQRTLQKLDSVLITPGREILPGRAVEAGLSIQDIQEFNLPMVHLAVASILDYLPQKALVLVDDLDILKNTVEDIEEKAVKLREDSIRDELLPDNYPLPYLTWSEIQDSLAGHLTLEMGRSTALQPSELAEAFNPGERFGGRLKPLMDHLVNLTQTGNRSIIVSRQVSRLRELWLERGIDLGENQSAPELLEGTLTEGWVLKVNEQVSVHLLTDSEIFGWERPQPRPRHKPTAEAPEAAYADLHPGDWVVHVDHGIGRYTGLVRRSLEGLEREFLMVEYLGGDQLFVPIHQADRLTRFIGPDSQLPSATRLGSGEWTEAKERAQAAVVEIAKDLLDLYSKRQVSKGFAFKNDSTWQQELEASFPYVETEDQRRSIQEVKNDMENDRPMDRLLCGDVGYGKTEVALRAAFKAVMDGKQVAILVPTTVLAQQHFDTFSQRLAAFPMTVEMLSRFRSPREQDVIVHALRRGEVDIVIGTHRLLQPDIAFRDLGLVIVDEEQRFGVTHKEYLKKLRTEVDVLTLTATPIPRTLYMALTGVRDISTINTPPDERLPVITHVGPYSPKLVKQAVLRELERGGQVFFVHNRVQTIQAMLSHLQNLVPEARIGVAHGQMPERDLSTAMHRFTHNEIDILLCTSIIESGLDIPNANTLIVDRGDAFGLAQLYQLRGRVGRGAQRAYAYFFRHNRKAPTPEGQERLEVIAENTQLGAGYSIAMRDLEMRGAGEILGSRQHGYIASVGFHLYTRLLAQAVKAQRKVLGLPDQENETILNGEGHSIVNVELPFSIGIPVDYVADQDIRLSLYRRLANVKNEPEVVVMGAEFSDRFGPLPEAVGNLIYQMRVKMKADLAGLASIGIESDQIVLRYPPQAEGMPLRSLTSLGPLARSGKNAYWLPYASKIEDWQERLMKALMILTGEPETD
jgi:transcription-repair coupling factor (superfamily II helicase)